MVCRNDPPAFGIETGTDACHHGFAVTDRCLLDFRQSGGRPAVDSVQLGSGCCSALALYVLAGSQGASLAFGPGHVDGTALPGEPGVSVLGGHRDTHFAVLQSAVPGDRILVQDRSKHWSEYAIVLMQVEDVRQSPYLSLPADEHLLVLVTCYPFDAVQPGGPLRFVVYAVREAGL